MSVQSSTPEIGLGIFLLHLHPALFLLTNNACISTVTKQLTTLRFWSSGLALDAVRPHQKRNMRRREIRLFIVFHVSPDEINRLGIALLRRSPYTNIGGFEMFQRIPFP
ncbi:unnamed protein product [Albugo candida]|uniref:Uncharacterized protein n=1 Tax=Albugo candida TaxID=65357 RepID=A0A024GVF2_9STRA|nr:unnamed protein product [Albugo candida]|eukprot:CCI50587.1 unnamed protein product [Albugo candida]